MATRHYGATQTSKRVCEKQNAYSLFFRFKWIGIFSFSPSLLFFFLSRLLLSLSSFLSSWLHCFLSIFTFLSPSSIQSLYRNFSYYSSRPLFPSPPPSLSLSLSLCNRGTVVDIASRAGPFNAVVRETTAEIVLHSGNVKSNTQKEERMSPMYITSSVYFTIHMCIKIYW